MPSQKRKSKKKKKTGWMRAQMEQDDRLGSLQKKDANLQDRIHDMNIQILNREQKSNSLRRKIALIRKRLVCRSSVSRKVFKGINALKEQRRMIENLNRMLEFRLNKTKTKSSTAYMLNNTLRRTIDLKRIDQTRKRKDCVKMDQELREIQARLAGLLLDADRVADEGFVLREKIERIATKNDHEIHRFHSDMHQLKEYILKSKEAMAMMEDQIDQQDVQDDEDMKERMECRAPLRAEDCSVVAPTIESENESNRTQDSSTTKHKVKIPNFFYSSRRPSKPKMYGDSKDEDEDLPARPLTAKELMEEIKTNAEIKKKRDASRKKNLQDESKMFESTHSNVSSSSSSSMKPRGLGVPSGPKLAVMSTMLPNRRSKRQTSSARRETLHAHTRRGTTTARSHNHRMKIKTSPKRKILKLPREPTF